MEEIDFTQMNIVSTLKLKWQKHKDKNISMQNTFYIQMLIFTDIIKRNY
jgi:hypothetical protein